MTMGCTNYLLAACVVLSISSCCSTQWVGKNSDLYTVTQGAPGSVTDVIKKHQVSGCAKAAVTPKDDRVEVKVESTDAGKVTPVGTSQTIGTGAGKAYTAAGSYLYHDARWTGDRKAYFQYTEGQYFLQPLTIALRFRGAVDTIPGSAESGFNLGLSYGYKINRVRWREEKNAFNSNTSRIGAAGGLLASLGATELSSSNTTGDAFAIARKVPSLSIGAMLAVSFNGFDVGFAGGIDQAIGGHADDWVYQGKPWWGLVLGLGLFK